MRDLKGHVCETGHFYVNGTLYSFYAQFDDVRCSKVRFGVNHMFKRVPSCEEKEDYMWLITEHIGDFSDFELMGIE